MEKNGFRLQVTRSGYFNHPQCFLQFAIRLQTAVADIEMKRMHAAIAHMATR